MWSPGTRNSSFKNLSQKCRILHFILFLLFHSLPSQFLAESLAPVPFMRNDFNHGLRKKIKHPQFILTQTLLFYAVVSAEEHGEKNHSDIMIHVECDFILFLVLTEKKNSAIFLYLYRNVSVALQESFWPTSKKPL